MFEVIVEQLLRFTVSDCECNWAANKSSVQSEKEPCLSSYMLYIDHLVCHNTLFLNTENNKARFANSLLCTENQFKF